MPISFYLGIIYSIKTLSTIFLCLVLFPYGDGNFIPDKNYVGVVFSPYSKYREGSIYPSRSAYNMEEIGAELQIVSTKFRNVTTYGVGVTPSSSTWQTGEGVGFTGMEAAKLNKEFSKLVISASIGVWQFSNKHRLNQEVKMAFDITEDANRVYPGTVWGITLSSNYFQGPGQAGNVREILSMARNISASRNIPVSLGIRIDICDKLLEVEKMDYLHTILGKLDYVICYMNPPPEPVISGVQYAVDCMAGTIIDIRKEMASMHPKLQVIFETGWPSAGINSQNLPTSTKLMSEYWTEVSIWASANRIPIYLFSAFDEPWQSAQTEDRKSPTGPCGADGHYGWWRRLRNEDISINSYVEKINEPELSLCAIEDVSQGSTAGIAITVILLILAVLVIFILYVKLKNTKAEKLTEEEIAEFENGVSFTDQEAENFEVALRLPYDRKLELEKHKFSIDRNAVLGSGAFGIVYKGKIEGTAGEFAFKTTKPTCPIENLKGLLSEIKLMIYIGKHENIAGIVAAYTGQLRDGEVYIALEYCSKGSLEKLLRSSNNKYVDIKFETGIDGQEIDIGGEERYVNSPRIIFRRKDRESLESHLTLCLPNFIKWSYHIANGMAYLASKKVIHADLATRNVLLTEDGTAKINDFGLSRKLYTYTNYVKKKEEPLPWRWMSIESLKQFSFSTQSDVWSYGVTLWEIFSLGDIPYPGLGWSMDFVEKLIQGLRLRKPSYATPAIYTEMTKCWNKDLEQRPTFTELADYFFLLKMQMDEKYYFILQE